MLRARLAVWAAVLVGCSGAPGPASDVLLITVDTLRPDYLSANGYDRSTTPGVDRLIAAGTYFEQALSPVPRTTPALASLLTGAYPHATQVRRLTDELSSELMTLPEALQGWGYQTRAVVSNGVLSPFRGLARGFESYEFASDMRVAEDTTNAALASLGESVSSSPVFLWVHYMDPHVPYVPDPEVAVEFDPDYRGPHRLGFGRLPTAERPGYLAYPVDLPKAVATHQNPLEPAVNAHIRRLYAGDIRKIDAEVERLVRVFAEQRGRAPIVVFTADHGESLGEHGLYFDHGDYVYNASSRVPLAIVLPDHSASGRCRGWVSLVDVVPTLVELLARELPPPMPSQIEGRSLAACLGGGVLPAAPVFSESGRSYFPHLVPRRVRNDVAGRFRAVVDGDWKLIWTPFQKGDQRWELYDLATDPHETRDLYAADHPQVERLRPMLESWAARGAAAEPGPDVELGEADRKALRALGYLE